MALDSGLQWLRSSTPTLSPGTAGQWLLGEVAQPHLRSCRGKGLGEGWGRVPQCCPPAPHPQALLSLSCVVASKMWKCQRAWGHSYHHKGLLGRSRYEEEIGTSLGRKASSKFLACLQPFRDPHLGTGANTVRHCSVTPYSRAQRSCPSPRKGGEEEGLRGWTFCLQSWLGPSTAECCTGEEMVGTDRHPHGSGASWKQPSLHLATGMPLPLPPSWGYDSLVRQRELALGGRMCSSKGCSGERDRAGAVSVGNRGLELLQAAPAELCSIRLSILGQLLGAHRLRSWRLFSFLGW